MNKKKESFKQEHATEYAQAYALASWARAIRIISIVCACIEVVVGIIVAVSVDDAAAFLPAFIVASAITVVWGLLASLILDVLSTTSIHTLNSADILYNMQSQQLDSANTNHKKHIPNSHQKIANEQKQSLQSKTSSAHWICQYCDTENLPWDNICSQCGEKKVE